jgi:hypothetical protein
MFVKTGKIDDIVSIFVVLCCVLLYFLVERLGSSAITRKALWGFATGNQKTCKILSFIPSSQAIELHENKSIKEGNIYYPDT